MKALVLGGTLYSAGCLAIGFAAAVSGVGAMLVPPIAFSLATPPIIAAAAIKIFDSFEPLVVSEDPNKSTLGFGLALFAFMGSASAAVITAFLTGMEVSAAFNEKVPSLINSLG